MFGAAVFCKKGLLVIHGAFCYSNTRKTEKEIPMATIKDVARLAGVSVATVSRVLNNKEKVNEKTCAVVEKALRELDYHPNDFARALVKTNESRIVAMISVAPNHPFFGELIFHIEEALSDRGYKLLLLTSYMNEEKEKKCAELINGRMIDGLIIGSYPLADPLLLNLPLPAVAVETAPGEGIPYIMSDEYQGGVLGTRHLIAKGCSRLVMVGGTTGPEGTERRMNERERGFVEVCTKNNVNYRIFYTDAEMIRSMDYSVLINRIFFEFPEVDGVFANSDTIAAEVLQTASAMGYSVPGDLKVIGFDGTYISRITNPPITTVAQNIESLAERTVDTLIAMIAGRPYQNKTIIPVKLVQRGTT